MKVAAADDVSRLLGTHLCHWQRRTCLQLEWVSSAQRGPSAPSWTAHSAHPVSAAQLKPRQKCRSSRHKKCEPPRKRHQQLCTIQHTDVVNMYTCHRTDLIAAVTQPICPAAWTIPRVEALPKAPIGVAEHGVENGARDTIRHLAVTLVDRRHHSHALCVRQPGARLVWWQCSVRTCVQPS